MMEESELETPPASPPEWAQIDYDDPRGPSSNGPEVSVQQSVTGDTFMEFANDPNAMPPAPTDNKEQQKLTKRRQQSDQRMEQSTALPQKRPEKPKVRRPRFWHHWDKRLLNKVLRSPRFFRLALRVFPKSWTENGSTEEGYFEEPRYVTAVTIWWNTYRFRVFGLLLTALLITIVYYGYTSSFSHYLIVSQLTNMLTTYGLNSRDDYFVPMAYYDQHYRSWRFAWPDVNEGYFSDAMWRFLINRDHIHTFPTGEVTCPQHSQGEWLATPPPLIIAAHETVQPPVRVYNSHPGPHWSVVKKQVQWGTLRTMFEATDSNNDCLCGWEMGIDYQNVMMVNGRMMLAVEVSGYNGERVSVSFHQEGEAYNKDKMLSVYPSCTVHYWEPFTPPPVESINERSSNATQEWLNALKEMAPEAPDLSEHLGKGQRYAQRMAAKWEGIIRGTNEFVRELTGTPSEEKEEEEEEEEDLPPSHIVKLHWQQVYARVIRGKEAACVQVCLDHPRVKCN